MNKKILISSLGTIALASSGLATFFAVTSKEKEQTKLAVNPFENTDSETTNTSGGMFDPSAGTVITAPVDIRAVVAEERDYENNWYAQAKSDLNLGTDFDYVQDAAIAWDYAAEYGWTIDKWSYYMNYLIEAGYPNATVFGTRFYWELANWQHAAFASDISSFPFQARWSRINPTYAGSLEEYDVNDLANSGNPTNVDSNDLTWYTYPHNSASTWFMFDENNVENAWKRLADGDKNDEGHDEPGMGIFEAAGNVAAIKDYKGQDVNGDEITRPDYFFVNGKLIGGDELTSRSEYYYVNDTVVTGAVKVTDDLGWPVLITKPVVGSDWDYEDLFSTVINPTDPSNAISFQEYVDDLALADDSAMLKEWNERLSGADGGADDDDNDPDTIDGYDNVEDELVATEVAYGSYNVANYAPGFLPLDKRDGGVAVDGVFTDNSPFWNGYYRIAYKKDNFYDHLNDIRYYHTQQHNGDGRFQPSYINWYSPGQSGNFSMYPGQRFMPDTYDIGGYTFIWIEDGTGGHKLWKKSNHLPYEIYADYSTDDDGNYINDIRPDPVGGQRFYYQNYWTSDVFWGNWHYAFQSPTHFISATEHYTDRKL